VVPVTGPEHYAEAERLLELARVSYVVTLPDTTSAQDVDRIKATLADRGLDEALIASESIRIDVTPMLLAAQVHATLALSAATAAPLVRGWYGTENLSDVREWVTATAPRRPIVDDDDA
jgi:hypothetical protein